MINKTMEALGSNRSAIRDLFEYGKQRAAEVGAENVYDFSLGNPSVPAPARVNEAIRELTEERSSINLHGYTSAIGDFDVRKAIADDLNERYGTSFTPAEFYMTCGAAAALASAYRALITPEADEIIGIAPFFPEYECFVKANGGHFSYVPQSKDFGIDFDTLASMITARTQAVIVNSPNNPCGVVYSEETIKKLADVLTKKSEELKKPIYLISDEPYRELVYDNIEVPFIPKYYRNTIVSYSYSKCLSLPGERIGYALVPKEADDAKDLYNAIAGAARICGYVCAPSMMQYMVEKCVKERPDLSEYDKNRKLLYNSLTEMGYECVYPQGAFYMFIKAPGGSAKAYSEHAKKYNLLLVPGDTFRSEDYLRASYCVDYDMIKRSLPAFKAALDDFNSNK